MIVLEVTYELHNLSLRKFLFIQKQNVVVKLQNDRNTDLQNDRKQNRTWLTKKSKTKDFLKHFRHMDITKRYTNKHKIKIQKRQIC